MAQAIEISLQAGSMMGVEKEERLATPWPRSLRSRHPWLQLNLLTAFLAAAVVGLFQDTLDRLVILALFLPVLAGQSGNTGCQALAVTLRGMTLGELKPGTERPLVMKETWVGCLNGIGVGIVLALIYWVMISVFAALGASGVLNPMLAAWAPNMIFGAVAAYLLLTVRT